MSSIMRWRRGLLQPSGAPVCWVGRATQASQAGASSSATPTAQRFRSMLAVIRTALECLLCDGTALKCLLYKKFLLVGMLEGSTRSRGMDGAADGRRDVVEA